MGPNHAMHGPGIDFRPLALSLRELWKAGICCCRKALPALPFFMLLLLVGVVYHLAAFTVTVSIDGKPAYTVRTFSRNVDELLKELNLELHPKDRLTPGRSSLLGAATVIEIEKAFPVFITADSSTAEIWTPPVKVSDLLQESGYTLGTYDRVEPGGLTAELEATAWLRLVRVEKKYTQEIQEISFTEVSRGNPALDRGFSRLVSEGRNGTAEQRIEIIYEDGVEISRSVVETVVLEEPVERVVEIGENTTLVREGREMQFDRALLVTATAYCPGTPGSGCPLDSKGRSFCTGSDNNGYTYTGKKAVQGLGTIGSPRMVAVDPRVIPLGSMLYIEEIPGIGKIGFAKAEDIGGAIKGNRIDILYDLHKDVARFGWRRNVKVYILTSY